MDRNQEYSQVLMERDGTGQLSSVYTYGNQRINYENYNNLTGIYTYDGRGSVSAVIGGYGDFRASYWYDGLGNVKSQVHGYGVFGSGKKYYGYNGEQYNPVTGNQNLRNRQVNIRRQRFLTEDTYIGTLTETLSINRYIYGNDNPLKFNDPSGFISNIIMSSASKAGPGVGCGGGSNSNYNAGFVSTGIIYSSSTMLYGSGIDTQQVFRDTIIHGFTTTETYNQALLNQRIDAMIEFAKAQAKEINAYKYWERGYEDLVESIKTKSNNTGNWKDNDVEYNDWYWGEGVANEIHGWCSVFILYNASYADLTDINHDGNEVEIKTSILPSKDVAKSQKLEVSNNLKSWYETQGRFHSIDEVVAGTYTPKKGDVFFQSEHSGFVTEYDVSNKKVSTVDGNTTNIPRSKIGYAVLEHKERNLDKYIGFGDNFYTGGATK